MLLLNQNYSCYTRLENELANNFLRDLGYTSTQFNGYYYDCCPDCGNPTGYFEYLGWNYEGTPDDFHRLLADNNLLLNQQS